MRIQFIIIHFLFICTSQVTAQRWCEVNGHYDEITELSIQNKSSIIRPRSERWFHVVVHDVSRSGSPVSDAQIVHQIDLLNNDFAKKGANIHKLREEFQNLAADTEIRFCLATEDPDGNPTSGVTYSNTSIDRIALATEMGRKVIHYDQLGGKTGWDPARYINIWIADYGESGILGYGSIPGTAPYPEEIGLVMDRKSFGATGSASSGGFYNKGHTLTHEMGHFFGLLHIWGEEDESCTDSDEVEDTPNATGPYLGCPSGRQESCGVSNMYQNFMDLTDDRCLAAFTHGQAMRMQATIDLFYPDLAWDAPCHDEIQSLEEWWTELKWAYDDNSDQYVLYNMKEFGGKVDVQVFSMDGRRITVDQLHGERSHRINMHGIPPGIYLVVINAGEQRFVRKIVNY